MLESIHVTNDDGDRVLKDLIALAGQPQSSLELVQFKTLVSADQYRRLYDLTQQYVRPGSAVLDWGCGNGHMTYALGAFGHHTTGYSLDASPPLAAFASSCRFESSKGGDPERLPFPDCTFDAVFSVGVLEHVRETGGTEVGSLREIKRILKPAGLFVCYHLPNRYSYIEAVAQFLPYSHHHRYRFTESMVRDLCARVGLEILDLRRYGALPRNPWQVMPRWLGNSRRVARWWDALDSWFEVLLSPVLQNYYFIARKSD